MVAGVSFCGGAIDQNVFPWGRNLNRTIFKSSNTRGKLPRGNCPGEIAQGKLPRGDVEAYNEWPHYFIRWNDLPRTPIHELELGTVFEFCEMSPARKKKPALVKQENKISFERFCRVSRESRAARTCPFIHFISTGKQTKTASTVH